MRRFFSSLFILLCVLVVGCKAQYSDFFPYHDDGTPKPYVALVPVFDESNSKLPWDLSQELTTGIRTQLKRSGKIYIPPEKELKKALASTSKAELTSSNDLMPFLHFQPAHMVVILELIEHKIVPYQRGKIKPLYPAFTPADEACVLMMKMRFKVVDIRGSEPKIIRQEVVDSNHSFSKTAMAESIFTHKEKEDVYPSTPLGLAHARLERDIAERIERITGIQRS